jgi:hypothetical protein
MPGDYRPLLYRPAWRRQAARLRPEVVTPARLSSLVRATWVKVGPDQIDRAIDFYKMTILPALEELEGFCSASLLLDRASGHGVASATFDSVEARERNKDQLDRLRATGSQEVAAEVLDVCDFELAVAHLRVPEMA